jgi:hypothetical protein
MMERLLAAIQANQEKMEATIKTGREEMKAEMKAMMEACLEKIKANQEKLEANQERLERVKVTHVLTTLKGRASDVLHGDSKEETYRASIGAVGDQFGGQHLAVGYRNQL